MAEPTPPRAGSRTAEPAVRSRATRLRRGVTMAATLGAVLVLGFACSFRQQNSDATCVGPRCAEAADVAATGPVDSTGMNDTPATSSTSPFEGYCGAPTCELGSECDDGELDPPLALPEPMQMPANVDASVIISDPSDEGDLDAGMSLDAGMEGDPPQMPDVPMEPTGVPEADAGVGPGPDATFACRLELDGADVVRGCGVVGTGVIDSPCTSTLNCAPGLACVGTQAATCRPLCCDGDSVCSVGTFCALRPLRLMGMAEGDERPQVPVCVAPTPCSLGEPFPCPDGVECSCPAEQTCTVVRNDGTTSCAVPGSGRDAESCPCAPGFFCSTVNQTCRRYCEIGSTSDTCGGAQCQASPSLPEGFGVCTEG